MKDPMHRKLNIFAVSLALLLAGTPLYASLCDLPCCLNWMNPIQSRVVSTAKSSAAAFPSDPIEKTKRSHCPGMMKKHAGKSGTRTTHSCSLSRTPSCLRQACVLSSVRVSALGAGSSITCRPADFDISSPTSLDPFPSHALLMQNSALIASVASRPLTFLRI